MGVGGGMGLCCGLLLAGLATTAPQLGLALMINGASSGMLDMSMNSEAAVARVGPVSAISE